MRMLTGGSQELDTLQIRSPKLPFRSGLFSVGLCRSVRIEPDSRAARCCRVPLRFGTAEPATSRHGPLAILWLARRWPCLTSMDGVFGKRRVSTVHSNYDRHAVGKIDLYKIQSHYTGVSLTELYHKCSANLICQIAVAAADTYILGKVKWI
jgi:hypothetical protein